MRFKLILLNCILLIYSCGGGQAIQQPAQENNQQDDINKKTETVKKENSSGDDELLELLEGKKETTKTSEKAAGNVDLGVTFQPLNKDTVKTEVKPEIKKEMQMEQKPETSAAKELNKLDDRVKSLGDNLDKKPVEKKEVPKTLPKNTVQKQTKTTPSIQQTNLKGSDSYENDYQRAYGLFQSRKYTDAIVLFQQLVDRNPKHQLADNAQYWIGESNFAKQNYRQAILDFEKVITFPKSNKNEDSQFKIAYCYVLLKDGTNARIELQRFISKYPKSRNINRAKKMLNSL
ncbi:MAG: tol-pal system protein YbgF [Calditrichaeota bacterium]|nr:tol-pal system protein YbgF [Calditrichota bacterium]